MGRWHDEDVSFGGSFDSIVRVLGAEFEELAVVHRHGGGLENGPGKGLELFHHQLHPLSLSPRVRPALHGGDPGAIVEQRLRRGRSTCAYASSRVISILPYTARTAPLTGLDPTGTIVNSGFGADFARFFNIDFIRITAMSPDPRFSTSAYA